LVIVAFRCDLAHAGQNTNCEPHSRNYGNQFCGYCASEAS